MNKELKSRESLQAELDEARKEIAFLRDELRLPAPEIGAANSSVLDDLEIRITELQAQNDELREAQDKLRETLGKYYDYFDSAPAAYFILDKNGFIKEINRAFAEMTGSSKKELSGKHLLFIINDDFQKVISDKLSLLADGENYQHCTVKINSGNNRSFFVIIECHQPVYGGDIRCIATGVNELANTAEAFKSVLENSPQGILIIKDDKIVYANQRISDLSGYAKDDFIGRDALKLSDFVHHDERVTMMSRYRKKMRLEDISAKYEYRLLRKDGSVKWIELCSDIIEYEGGTALQAALIDIHDRKISEEKLKEINFELDKRVIAKAKDLEKTLFELDQEILINKKTNDELVNTKKELDKLLKIEQDLNEIKDRFISTISHEYRTPLTIIMSSTYLIRQFLQHGNSEEIIKQLEKVRKSVKTLTGLIDNIVNLEHVDSPANIYNVTELTPDVYIKNIIYDKFPEHKGRIKFKAEGKPAVLRTDPALLTQIIVNLTDNALKYSPGRVDIEVRSMNNELIMTVTDYGDGIAEEDKLHLFFPFYRGKKNIGIIEGSGLGLNIVKRCVESLKGVIKLTEEPGKGCVFTVKLPYN